MTTKRNCQITIQFLNGLSYGKIGKEYKLSNERIRQIVVKTLRKVNVPFTTCADIREDKNYIIPFLE